MFVKGTLKKAGVLLTLGVLALLLGYSFLTFLFLTAIAFLIQFFRDPKRSVPKNEGYVVAAADGKVFNGKIDRIQTVDSSDPVVNQVLPDDQEGILISTFMSPFDVHVNRAPISGKVLKSIYFPGKFKIASGNVSTRNEKNLLVIESKYGRVGVVQIAGFVARRIVQYVEVGDFIGVGEKIGMIKFGSRVDVIIPKENSRVLVSEGEKPTAGETVIAQYV